MSSWLRMTQMRRIDLHVYLRSPAHSNKPSDQYSLHIRKAVMARMHPIIIRAAASTQTCPLQNEDKTEEEERKKGRKKEQKAISGRRKFGTASPRTFTFGDQADAQSESQTVLSKNLIDRW